MGRCRRVVVAVLVVALAAGVTSGLSGCSLLRGVVNQQLTTEENLANQRKFALEFIHDDRHPELEYIRYMSEGGVNGAGSWGASVVVTVDGKEYEGRLGDLTSGEPLPKAPLGAKPGDVTVNYTDGTSEVLK